MARKFLDYSGLGTYDEKIKEYIDELADSKENKKLIVNITQTTADDGTKTYSADKTFAETEEAIVAGRNVILQNGTGYFNVTSYSIGKSIIFTTSNAAFGATMGSIVWNNKTNTITYNGNSLERTNNKTTALSSDSTHTQYPSAKAVVDYVGEQISSHNHDDKYYTEEEIDQKLSAVNTNITNITSGSTPVKEAEHATSADTATNATNANHASSADTATTATSATKATQDGNGKVIANTYETKADAQAKLDEAKTYADSAASKVKNDLLNGAGAAYDTLKELGDLIDDNKDAIDALNDVAASKADKEHSHAIADVTNLQTQLDEISEKANESATFVVNIAENEDENGEIFYSADKTFAEVVEAYESGRIVKASFRGFDFPCIICDEHIGIIGFRIYDVGYYNENVENSYLEDIRIIISPSNEVIVNDTYSTLYNSYHFENEIRGTFFVDDLETEDKTIVGAINELDAELDSHNHDDMYYTQVQVDTKLSEKANTSHSHAVGDVINLQSALDGKSDTTHSHEISDITNLQTTLNNASSAISANTSSISAHSDRIGALETKVGDGFEEITSAEIQALF